MYRELRSAAGSSAAGSSEGPRARAMWVPLLASLSIEASLLEGCLPADDLSSYSRGVTAPPAGGAAGAGGSSAPSTGGAAGSAGSASGAGNGGSLAETADASVLDSGAAAPDPAAFGAPSSDAGALSDSGAPPDASPP